MLYIILAALAVTVQAVYFTGIKPDTVLVLVCYYALQNGRVRAMTYGAAAGLLLDLMSGFIVGPHILSKALAGYVTGLIREQIFHWNLFLSTLLVTVLSVVNVLVVYLTLETFSALSFANRSSQITIREIWLTVAVSVALYPFFRHSRVKGADAVL